MGKVNYWAVVVGAVAAFFVSRLLTNGHKVGSFPSLRQREWCTPLGDVGLFDRTASTPWRVEL